MVLTFLIEVSIAIYTVARYKLNVTGRIILAILVCLALFQLAEYQVCTNSGAAMASARLGYAAITLLPPLGLCLMLSLVKQLNKFLTALLFALPLVFVGYFLLAPTAFQGYQCTGNYVIFQTGIWQSFVYGTYYYALILTSVLYGLLHLRSDPKSKAAKSIKWLLFGYAVFIVPVATLVVLQPNTQQAIPSIMCGFAVFFALILGFLLVPNTLHKK